MSYRVTDALTGLHIIEYGSNIVVEVVETFSYYSRIPYDIPYRVFMSTGDI